jgi:hypothetical protein
MWLCTSSRISGRCQQNHDENLTRQPLLLAAGDSRLEFVRCLLRGSERRQLRTSYGSFDGQNAEGRQWLVKAGADPQASRHRCHMELNVAGYSSWHSRITDALPPNGPRAWRTRCSSPGTSGAGDSAGCTRRTTQYVGEPCQLAHWKAAQDDCKRWRISWGLAKVERRLKAASGWCVDMLVSVC